MTRTVQVAIIGAGTAGLNAMGQVRRVTDDFVLINGGELGTTCARVGCMPSKAAIQVAEDIHRRHIYPREGITGGDALAVDVDDAFEHVRDIRDILVDGVISHSTDEMGEEFIEGYATFVEPGVLEVNGERIEAGSIVLAAGTKPVVPDPWREFGDAILTTDEIFELETWPESMAVIGLGAIGLELGQAIARMGVEVAGFDILETIGGIDDEAVRKTAIELIGKEFPLHLGAEAEITRAGDKLKVSNREHEVVVDKVLVAMGRRSLLHGMSLDKAGIPLRDDGLPDFNPNTTRAGDSRVFVAGDGNEYRQILHEAAAEGRIAGYNAAREDTAAFVRTVSFAICFSDPNICHVGARAEELDDDEFVVGEAKFGPSGRALIMGRNKGLLRLYARKADGRLLGAAMVAPGGEHIAHLLAWSIEQNLTVRDLAAMPYYHPVLEEALQSAVRDAIGKLPELQEGKDYPLDLRPLEELLP